mmetsp:Transcript_52739/g.114507  ORF Transcript_52739/g.114507 Transcript_52739/m.114507 type:complete len:237 (-) Transcript_52739:2072-2782(-)
MMNGTPIHLTHHVFEFVDWRGVAIRLIAEVVFCDFVEVLCCLCCEHTETNTKHAVPPQCDRGDNVIEVVEPRAVAVWLDCPCCCCCCVAKCRDLCCLGVCVGRLADKAHAGISVVEEVGDVSQGAGELEVFDVLTELSEPALVLLFESVELCCEIGEFRRDVVIFLVVLCVVLSCLERLDLCLELLAMLLVRCDVCVPCVWGHGWAKPECDKALASRSRAPQLDGAHGHARGGGDM